MNALSLARKSLAAVAAAALVVTASTAWAASTPVTMQITVTPQQSVNGVIPTNPGNSPNAVYEYSTIAGDSLSDSIPVNVCITTLTDDGTLSAWSVNIDIGSDAPAGNLTGVDPSPSTVTFSKGDGVGTCKVSTIVIASDPLQDISAGVDYNKNIKITYDNPPGKDDVAVNLDGLTHLRIMVTVNPAPGSRLSGRRAVPDRGAFPAPP